MSGRHTMPPAGRRKAAAAAENSESTSPETETVEESIAEEPAAAGESAGVESVVEESVDAEETEVDEADVTEADEAEADETEADETADEPAEPEPSRARSRVSLPVVLGALALVLALTSGALRWLTVSEDQSATARDEAVQAAKEITAQMLSYETETVDQQLSAARDRMTGDFLGTYTAMINEVIPAAHAQQIAAVAEVLRAGTVSVKPGSVEMVLFVNQSVQVGNHMPQKTPSVARATLVKVDDRWLMSEYEPVPL
jgi:Mce-associated membrane protein